MSTNKLTVPVPSERKVKKDDLRRKSTQKCELQFPDFYYTSSMDGWFCKTCSSFAPKSGKEKAFIDIPRGFGDHSSDRAALHQNSKHHKLSVLNKQAFDELRKNYTDVYKMLVDTSLSNAVAKTTQNRFVIKSFFRIIHFMVIKNWAYNSNFKDLVELNENCGGSEIKTQLISSPKNAYIYLYTSALYISKLIDIIDEYIKLPLLASLRENYYTFITDETTKITSIKQMAVYAIFEHNNQIKENFFGTYPLSKVVGAHLTAGNIMQSLEKYFEDSFIDLSKAQFSCVDTTNVN